MTNKVSARRSTRARAIDPVIVRIIAVSSILLASLPTKADSIAELARAASQQSDPAPTSQLRLRTAGAVYVAVNLPSIAGNEIRLTEDLLAAIYLGDIRMWDDPRLQAINRRLALPHQQIAPLHRADPSVATLVLTAYLARASAAWRTRFGSDFSVAWPTGTGAVGAGQLVSLLRSVPGSIAYVEAGVARAWQLPTARMLNHAGQFVSPDPLSLASAQRVLLASSPNPNVRLVDGDCADCWPLFAAPLLRDAPGTPGGMIVEDWVRNNSGAVR